jgi:hypothetical protein
MKKLALGVSNADLLRIGEHNQNTNNFIAKNIKKIENNDTEKKLIDYNYELNYPADWTVKDYIDAIIITDSEKDYYLEKKAIININYIKNKEEIELNNFNIGSKPGASKSIDKNIQINDYNILKQAFSYDNTYEEQIIIQKNSKEYLSLTLVTTYNSNSHYKEIFENYIKKNFNLKKV